MSKLGRAARVHLIAVTASATITLTLLVSRSKLAWLPLVGFGLLFVLSEGLPVKLANTTYSVGFVVALAAIIAVGPASAGLAACFAAFDLLTVKLERPYARLTFNAAQFSLSTVVAGFAYTSLGGPVGKLTGSNFPGAILPIAAATVSFFVVNTLLVSGMVSFANGLPWTEVLHSDYRSAAASYFSFALLGVTLAHLYLEIGWGAVLFLLVPLLVARHAFQASAKLERAFESTFKTLVAAIEAKDLYTRGHAERVSRLASMTAREIGLAPRLVRQVRFAALMHDVGKLAVETKVLQKAGKLTVEEFEHMKIHPIKGSEIVSEIDLLKPMVDGVRHHHERLDGKGYPDGLVGDQLSQIARIIMAADAFDSMTSTRSYRRAMPVDTALAEMRRCAGTQFAAEAIDALERAVRRSSWAPTPEMYVGELTPRPEVSPHLAHG